MANKVRNFEPTAVWANPDGTLSERARGWTRSVFDFIGAGDGTVPIGSLGGDGGTSTFLRADGNFAVPAYPVGANPSTAVDLTASNGTATTFMRSDAAPALNLAISPAWTAAHTFNAGLVSTTIQGTSGVFSTTMQVGTGFGCNGKTPQTAVVVNAAVAGTAGAAYGAAEQTILNGNTALLNQIRAALVAIGIAA